jgi:hypothetical protein
VVRFGQLGTLRRRPIRRGWPSCSRWLPSAGCTRTDHAADIREADDWREFGEVEDELGEESA